MTKETRNSHTSGRSQRFSKFISILTVLILVMGTAVSFAQSETEEVTEVTATDVPATEVTTADVTERRLKVSDYRQRMMSGWIGQMVGVGWGASTEFQFTNQIIPEDEVPEWTPDLVNV